MLHLGTAHFDQLEEEALFALREGAAGVERPARAFASSNRTELDFWLYIERERIALPRLSYAHPRSVVRFGAVGDMSCTCPVTRCTMTAAEVVDETVSITVSERGAARMDDRTSASAMERRKKEGYF